MAVGMTEHCEKCGDSWDSGRESRAYHDMMVCQDRLNAQQKFENKVKAFNAKTVDERLEYLYRRLLRLSDEVDSIPYYGPIG